MSFGTAKYSDTLSLKLPGMKIRLRDVVDSPCGMRFMVENLGIYSGFARKKLLDSQMMLSADEIGNYYSNLKEVYDIFSKVSRHVHEKESLQHKFCDLKDINGTVRRIEAKAVLDDIELFEIKSLALLSIDVKEILVKTQVKCIDIPDLEDVLSALDPEGTRIRSFYVYDSYSEELRLLRNEIRKSNDESRQELEIKEKQLECKIRADISGRLYPYAVSIQLALDSIAELDILLAKVVQIEESGLTFPVISDNGETSYSDMFHPQVKCALRERLIRTGSDAVFTPISIRFGERPVIITGANMGGKTVTLMMCALAQYLFQFGFGIPARECSIAVRQGIFLTMGDGQDINGGYSSFAAEMLSVNQIIKVASDGMNILALIDEPARTTNPIEGRALVQGMLDVLSGYHISVIVSTHYNVDKGDYERLRVVGFVDGKMDYRLIEAKKGDVPHEAVKIAESLGIDDCWLKAANKYLID